MLEQQNIEYKSVWRDEYLKWVCGFANASGGTLVIGKSDEGEIVGLSNTKRLLEDIPNKIKDILGIVADVNLHKTKHGDFIEILIAPQPNPVNYKGEYHYRSGATKQELKGTALDRFLLKKQGLHWDSGLVTNAKISDLKQETLALFIEKGIRSKRINKKCNGDSSEQLLENLKLIENGCLKRAAILLFHPDPEKFITGAYIKIGFFRTDSDLLFQDEIHGNLFEQIEKTMELLQIKYTRSLISYEGISRVETLEYPREALREAILNAVAHKDYLGATPIQISVYADKIMIWNFGQLPEGWTAEDLLKKHSSQPHNPDIANALFRVGYIESWGRGVDKMIEQCVEAKMPLPKISVKRNDFWVIFRKDTFSPDVLENLELNQRQINAVLYAKEKGRITNGEYQKINNIGKSVAISELHNLVEKQVLIRFGKTGRGTHYKVAQQTTETTEKRPKND